MAGDLCCGRWPCGGGCWPSGRLGVGAGCAGADASAAGAPEAGSVFSELAGRRGRNEEPGTWSPVLSVPAPSTSLGISTVPGSGSTFPTADDEAGADNATVFMGAGPRVRPNAQTDPRARVRAASMVPRNLRAGAIGWLKTRSIELPATCIPALISGSLYGIILADLHPSRGALDECSAEQT